jgi:uncharacterized protein YecE (DUF72 family)
MDPKINNLYLGTSGILLPVPNKEHYPPAFRERSMLCYYASMTNSIEVNSSFYKIPMAETIGKWAADVPGDFRFTFKIFRELTHHRGHGFDANMIKHFMDAVQAVGDKRACLLLQFPASVKIAQLPMLERLVAAFAEDIRAQGWDIALEFRHASLYSDQLNELLEYYGMGLVIHDKPGAPPMGDSHPEFSYLRLHGPGGNYRGSYTDDILYEHAGYVAEWLRSDKRVYVYFNNTMGSANANLERLRGFVIAQLD